MCQGPQVKAEQPFCLKYPETRDLIQSRWNPQVSALRGMLPSLQRPKQEVVCQDLANIWRERFLSVKSQWSIWTWGKLQIDRTKARPMVTNVQRGLSPLCFCKRLCIVLPTPRYTVMHRICTHTCIFVDSGKEAKRKKNQESWAQSLLRKHFEFFGPQHNSFTSGYFKTK